ncbi:hypothetical protein POK33_38175 [Burkholderia cenocepacia]|uniref:hypothetical protein n=1 Tax=Burkholderia cenocepacia TaxID=95486 RepID=UPI0023B8BF24|nr:hypothetical protein [Burkholderia cenocepacia]MDF0506583.1 hypothetical protein [Burkholderia cenocepacia]
MNARTDSAVLAQAADVTDVDFTPNALTVPTQTATGKLEITEVLDALPRDDQGNAITSITPIKFDLTDAALTALRERLSGATFDVATPEGMKAAKATVGDLTKLKKGMEDAYTQWNKPILAMTKQAREQRDYATSEIEALREPIKKQIDDRQAEIDRQKNEAAVAESRRIDGHTAALSALQTLPDQFVTASSADIESAIADLSSFEYLTRRDWEEFTNAAQDAQRASIEALKLHLTNAKAREELAVVRAQQEAEEAARRAQAEAEEAERNRVAGLKERIHTIQLSPTTCVGLPAAQIQRTLDRLEKTDAAEFAELREEAQQAIDGARSNLQTMLQAAKDADELAEFRAMKEQNERAEREKAEAAERAAREAAAQAERERQEAARQARERAEAVAETMRDLLIEARAHVPAGDLADRIDLAIATAQGV